MTEEGSIEFACPYCDRITRVPAAYGGKQGKCPGCQKVIEVPNPTAEVSPAPAASALEATLLEPPPVPGSAATLLEPPPIPGSAAMGAEPMAAMAPPAAPEQAIGTPVTEASPSWRPQTNAPAGTGTPMGVLASAGGAAPDSGSVAGPERPCPSCGEQIKAAAKKCKFCGEFLDERLRAQRRGSITAPVGKLASPWTRFAAFLLDSLLCYVPMSLVIGAGIAIADQTNTDLIGILAGVAGTVWMLGYNSYSWYLIATRGQNITKRWFGIKIVKTDGNPVDFVSGVLLRNWVMFFVALFVPCYLGHIANWVGWLMIFSEDRRCLHDQIASTVVVEV